MLRGYTGERERGLQSGCAATISHAMKQRVRPLKIKAPHGASAMTIEWSDGHKGHYPHEILRGYCPCAECQGHSGTIKFKTGGSLELVDISTVGNYAISLSWADGHSTGIYNFDYLRMLCRCELCAPEGQVTADMPDLPKA